MIPLNTASMVLLGAAAAAPLGMAALEQFRSGPADVSLRQFRRKELGLVDYLPFEELIEHDVVLATGGPRGALGAMFELTWEDTSTDDKFARIGHAEWLNDALVTRRPGWMHHTYTIRTAAAPLEPPSFIVDDSHQVLVDSHRERLAGVRYAVRHIVALSYEPAAGPSRTIQSLVFEGPSPVEDSYERVRDEFERGLQAYEDSLRCVVVHGGVRRLGTHPQDPSRNELLETIHQILYDDVQPIRVPSVPVPIGSLLATRDINPTGSAPMIGSKHLRVLSVFGYPTTTSPGMLDDLLRLPGLGFRYATRCVFEDPELARKKLEKRRKMWTGQKTSLANKAIPGGLDGREDRWAAANEEQVDEAILAAQTGKVAFVHFSAKMLFFDDSLEALYETLREARRVITNAGLTVKEETLNTVEAYLGHLPFCGQFDAREMQVDTRNVGRLWPSFSPWPGRKIWNCGHCGDVTVPALIGVTDTGEDFFIDPHDDDTQSTLWVGAPGSGKTTDLNTLAANYRRAENDQVFGIDKNNSQLVTCAFLGGDYRQDRQYSLFDGLHDADKRDYLVRFLERLALVNGVPVEPRCKDKIKAAVESMIEFWERDRSLSTFLGQLRASVGNEDDADRGERKVVDALSQYAVGGVHRGIFDGVGARVGSNSYEVHDLGHLLGGNQDDTVAAPALVWILHSFEDRFPGHRTNILIDEAWACLQSELVSGLFDEQLRTLRFRHAGIGFFTQTLAEIKDTTIASTVFAACKTRVLYPNPSATSEARGLYEGALGLSAEQIRRVATGTPKRDCNLSTSDRFGSFRLPRSKAELAVYGCTGKDQVGVARRLIEDFPNDWRERHLRAYGCDLEADRLRSLRLSDALTFKTITKELVTR